MKRREKTRQLWLQVKAYAPGVSGAEVKRVLIASIRNGSYSYPKEWKVGLFWRNKFNAPMRSGEFKREMQKSAEASQGFDSAVLNYLRSAKF